MRKWLNTDKKQQHNKSSFFVYFYYVPQWARVKVKTTWARTFVDVATWKIKYILQHVSDDDNRVENFALYLIINQSAFLLCHVLCKCPAWNKLLATTFHPWLTFHTFHFSYQLPRSTLKKRMKFITKIFLFMWICKNETLRPTSLKSCFKYCR